VLFQWKLMHRNFLAARQLLPVRAEENAIFRRVFPSIQGELKLPLGEFYVVGKVIKCNKIKRLNCKAHQKIKVGTGFATNPSNHGDCAGQFF